MCGCTFEVFFYTQILVHPNSCPHKHGIITSPPSILFLLEGSNKDLRHWNVDPTLPLGPFCYTTCKYRTRKVVTIHLSRKNKRPFRLIYMYILERVRNCRCYTCIYTTFNSQFKKKKNVYLQIKKIMINNFF